MAAIAGGAAETEGWLPATRGDRLFIEAVLFRAKQACRGEACCLRAT